MKFRLIDIGANLTDPMFQGVYNGSKKHLPDLTNVLERAWENGLEKIMITVGRLSEIDESLNIAKTDDRLSITVGCHPTRCNEFTTDPVLYFNQLCKKIEENPTKVSAIGECGLDYDRLNFCEKEIQKKYFEKQLVISEKFKLPLFLHCRNSYDDFLEIVTRNKQKIFGGVVHSFDGTIADARRIIDLGLFIGINGCSLKTKENLDCVRQIPLDRILIETDSPWCGVRPTHAGAEHTLTKFPTVKKKENWKPDILINGRNEPCQIIQILEIIAGIRQEPIEELADIIYNNTLKLFFQK